MLFPTLDFLLFFIVVLAVMVPLAVTAEWRKLALVAASYFFYAQWNWHYCLLLAGSSLLTYAGGIAIGAASSQRTRKLIVGVTVAMHLLLLSTFKYLDFLVGSANHLLHALGTGRELPFMEIILPVGISFFTFHGISYLVDVYRGDVAVCRRPVDILLYLSFFPQLVAGPIVRAAFFLPQLARPPAERVPLAEPVLLILGGLFKKVVIATYLATDLVDPVFFDPSRFGTHRPGARGLWLRGADLLRLLRLHRHGDRSCGAARLSLSAQLRSALPRAEPARVLAALAHLAVVVAARLSLQATRRQSRQPLVHRAQPDDHHAARRDLARRGVEVRRLGRAARRRPGDRALAATMVRRLGAQSWGARVAVLIVFHIVCLGWILFRADSFDTVVIYLTTLVHGQDAEMQATPFTIALIVLGLALHAVPRDVPGRLARLCSASALPGCGVSPPASPSR